MREIILTKGYVALVDDEDYERVNLHRWYADVGQWNVYAKCDAIEGRPRMHVFIMKPPRGLIVHHDDCNGLNNQKRNLEVMSQADHSRLSRARKNKKGSKYRGVYPHKDGGWSAECWINYKKHYLGYYETEEAAALMYNRAMETLVGDRFMRNVIE